MHKETPDINIWYAHLIQSWFVLEGSQTASFFKFLEWSSYSTDARLNCQLFCQIHRSAPCHKIMTETGENENNEVEIKTAFWIHGLEKCSPKDCTSNVRSQPVSMLIAPQLTVCMGWGGSPAHQLQVELPTGAFSPVHPSIIPTVRSKLTFNDF